MSHRTVLFTAGAAAIVLSACSVPEQVTQAPTFEPERQGPTAKRPADQDLMLTVDRWNSLADRMPVELAAPFGRVRFHWDGFRFPHPTFKGGSAQAYAAFGKVLAAFLEDPQNFEFLAKGDLFTANLRSGVPGGARGPDEGWTLLELAAQFQARGPLGAQDEATRASLRISYERMRAVETQRRLRR